MISFLDACRLVPPLVACLTLPPEEAAQESGNAPDRVSQGLRKPVDRAAEGNRGRSPSQPSRERRAVELKDPTQFIKSGDQPLFSGPQPNEALPAMTVTGVCGDVKGRKVDPVANAGGRPLVLMFQDVEGSGLRGTIGLARVLERMAANSESGLEYMSILLGDDSEMLKERASRIERFLPDFVQVGISEEGREGPGSYGLDRNVAMTILVARDGRVLHNFVFPQSMLYPDGHVLGAVAEAIGEERKTVTKWLEAKPNDAAPMRGNSMERNAPTDSPKVKLRQKLAAMVEAGKLSRVEANELYKTAFPDG
ncbi:MAG: hypothetical protein AAGJ40_11560 [Planctomycetota bacterium]